MPVSRFQWNTAIINRSAFCWKKSSDFLFQAGFCFWRDSPTHPRQEKTANDAKIRGDICSKRIPDNGRRPAQRRIPLVFNSQQIAFRKSALFISSPKHRTVNALLIVLCFFLFSGDLFFFRHFLPCSVPYREGTSPFSVLTESFSPPYDKGNITAESAVQKGAEHNVSDL